MPPLDPKQRVPADAQLIRSSGVIPARAPLFHNLSLFLVQRLPLRSTFIAQLESNGAAVVKLEAGADYIIADHARRDAPPGSVSYTWIEASLRDGRLAEPADHPAGPAADMLQQVRRAAWGTSTRTPFTAEDDRVLWRWVEEAKARGASVLGNEIYKQLEQQNARHTYQSWRDRYVKKLRDKAPVGMSDGPTVSANASPSPPQAPHRRQAQQTGRTQVNGATGRAHPTPRHPAPTQTLPDLQPNRTGSPAQSSYEESLLASSLRPRSPTSWPHFTPGDFEALKAMAQDIENVPRGRYEEAWAAWAVLHPVHGADEWVAFYEGRVRPEFRAVEEEAARSRRAGKQKVGDVSGVWDSSGVEGFVWPPGRNPFTNPHRRAPGRGDMSRLGPGDERAATEEVAAQTTKLSPASRAAMRYSLDGDDAEESSRKRKPQPRTKAEVLYRSGRKKPRTDTLSANPSTASTLLERGAKLDDAIMLDDSEGEEGGAGTKAAQDEDVRQSGVKDKEQNARVYSVPTSDADRAAALQLAQEDAADFHDQDAHRSNSDVDDDKDDESDFTSEEAGPTHPLPTNSAPLTSENLARTLTQQGPRPARATDLAEDGAEANQSDFIAYMQHATGQHVAGCDEQAAAQAREPSSAGKYIAVSVTPENGALPLSGASEEELEEGLPMSEPRAIIAGGGGEEGTVYTGLRLSSSPARSQPVAAGYSRASDESQEFATQILAGAQRRQVPNPRLASREAVGRGRDLSNHGKNFDDGGIETRARHSLEWERQERVSQDPPSQEQRKGCYDSLGIQTQTKPSAAGEPSTIEAEGEVVGEDELPSSQVHVRAGNPEAALDGEAEEDMDFSLAEPDGGFPLSSPVEADSLGIVTEPPPRAVESAAKQREPIADISSQESSSSSASSAEERDMPRSATEGKGRGRLLDTQVILDAETQMLDFDMPLPPDANSESQFPASQRSAAPSQGQKSTSAIPSSADDPSSHPKLPSSTPAAPRETLDSFITRLTHRGYTEPSILDALQMTTMRPELAEFVLGEQRFGRDVPSDIPGIWSAAEDSALEGGDARELRRLEEKHGGQFAERMTFLEELRGEAEEEEEG